MKGAYISSFVTKFYDFSIFTLAECYNKQIKETRFVFLAFNCMFVYRRRLFSMINDLPTVFEVVTEKKPVKDMVHGADGGSKSKSGTKVTKFEFNSIPIAFGCKWEWIRIPLQLTKSFE